MAKEKKICALIVFLTYIHEVQLCLISMCSTVTGSAQRSDAAYERFWFVDASVRRRILCTLQTHSRQGKGPLRKSGVYVR
jgi:hypothetical protein